MHRAAGYAGPLRLPGTGAARWIRRGAAAALAALLSWQERARQRRSLEALDDRLLKDIGLSRADVFGEATKRFWQS